MKTLNKSNIWYKISAVFISQIFILSSLAVAPVSVATAKPTVEDGLLKPDSISVSSRNGSVYKVYTAPQADKLVIHIQDAHCNPGVQHNICNILDNLNSDYEVGLIGVEGARGWVDTAILNAIPDPAVRKEITGNMVSESIIDGATEFAGNQEDITAALYGIESKELYLNNLKAYADVSRTGKDALEQVAIIKDTLINIQPHILNNDLQEFITANTSYKANEISMGDYIDSLAKNAGMNSISLESYPNIKTFQRSYAMEKDIDFDAVDNERTELIDSLTSSLAKDKLSELVTKSLHFRTGSMESAEYYTYLSGLVPAGKSYPNLQKYTDYVKINAGLDKNALSKEKDELENALKQSLIKTPEEKRMVSLSEDIELLNRLFSIKLTRAEFNRYKEGTASFQEFLAFIKENAPKYGVDFAWDKVNTNAFENCIKSALSFYDAALKREDVFVENLLKQMDTSNITVSVLITGGFHTDKIEEILQAKGVSYIVIRPLVTARASEGVYNRIMNKSAESMIFNTLAPPNALGEELLKGNPTRQELIDFLIANKDKLGLTQSPAEIAKIVDVLLTLDLSKFPDIVQALAQIEKNKADFQTILYSRVPVDVLQEPLVKEIYDGLLNAVKEKYSDVVEIESKGIAFWNFHNEKREVATNALRLFALIVARSEGETSPLPIELRWKREEMKSYVLMIMEHEDEHERAAKDRSLEKEIKITINDAERYKKLDEVTKRATISKLIVLYNGGYNRRDLGIEYEPDTEHALFIDNVVNLKTDVSVAATLLVTGQLAERVKAAVSAIPQVGPMTVMDIEFLHRAYGITEAGELEETAKLGEDVTGYYRDRGLSSVVIENGLKNQKTAEFVTLAPGEIAKRLIVTAKGNESTELMKQILANSNLVYQEEIAPNLPLAKNTYLIQFELSQIEEIAKIGPGALSMFTTDVDKLSKIKGASDQIVFKIQIVDNNGVAVNQNQIEKIDKTLAGIHSKEPGSVNRIFTAINVSNAKNYATRGKLENQYYLPVSNLFGVPVLASLLVDKEEVLKTGNIKQLSEPAQRLFNLVYHAKEGKTFSEEFNTEQIRDMFITPWSIADFIIRILAPIPLNAVDWNSIDLMTRMIRIQA